MSEPKTLLLLEPDDNIRDMVQSVVLDHDLSMQATYNVDDAQRALTKGGIFAFVFNLGVIAENPLDFIRRVKQERPELPLLAVVDGFSQGLTVELLKAGTYACLALPLQIDDLSFTLNKIIANSTDTYSPFAMRYEERTLIMPNDFSLVMQVAKEIIDSTLPNNGRNRYHVILGLSEVINNAIEHGNLGISFEEKSNALKASRFYPLAIERANKEPYKDRVVTVRSRVFPSLKRLEYFVADQGVGFDWRSLPDPKEKSRLLNRNGRGIMMAKYAFDELTYNEIGNEVTLVVNLDSPARGKKG